MRTARAILVAIWAALILAGISRFVQARAQPVDVALVLAMDVSGSIDAEEYRMQADGTAAALRAPRVVAAVGGGPFGAIAVAVVQWSGAGHQRIAVPWTRVGTAAELSELAGLIETMPRAYSDWTAVGEAIDFSAETLALVPWSAGRRVIDISGDGVNNSGRPVEAARDAAVAAGIQVNGLPILNEDQTLGAYYEDNVIGGAGAFVVPARDFGAFGEAMIEKLRTEIAGGMPRYAAGH